VSIRGAGRAAVLVLGLAAVAQWWAGTAPFLALVAAYVAVLLVLAQLLPLRVAVSAAFVALLGCYLALLVAVPLVMTGPLRPGTALAILLAPCLAATTHLSSEPAVDRPVRVPSRSVLAALGGGAVLVVAVLLAARNGPYGAVAWTTSGDARNHLLDARGVIRAGGLHGQWLTGLPMFHEGVMALLLDSHGRGTASGGALLRRDLHAYAATSAALAVLWTLATTALLLGFGRIRGRAAPVVVLAASLLPLAGLGLGVAMRDGFVPILLLQPLLLCSLAVLTWLTTTDDTGTPVTVAVGITALALPLAATTWTPFFVVLCGACAVPWLLRLRGGRQRAARLALMAAGVLAGSAVCLAVISNTDGFLTLPGSIAAPSPVAAAVLPALVLAMVAGRWAAARRLAFAPYAAGTLVAAGIVAWSVAEQSPGQAWNYYPSKVAWIWALVTLPLLLLPFLRRRPGRVAGVAVVLVAALALSPVASPVLPASLGWAQTGLNHYPTVGTWTQPTPSALELAVRLGDGRRHYVVYAVDPAQDRITNFWLAVYTAPPRSYFADPLVGWAYTETGTIQDVCALLGLQPGRVVATADPAAQGQLEAQCGHPVEVRLVSGIHQQLRDTP